MKQDVAGQASLAINKVNDWSRRTIDRSRDWFEVQRAKYSEVSVYHSVAELTNNPSR